MDVVRVRDRDRVLEVIDPLRVVQKDPGHFLALGELLDRALLHARKDDGSGLVEPDLPRAELVGDLTDRACETNDALLALAGFARHARLLGSTLQRALLVRIDVFDAVRPDGDGKRLVRPRGPQL